MIRSCVPAIILSNPKLATVTVEKASDWRMLYHLLPYLVPNELREGRTALKIHDINVGYVTIIRLPR